MFKTILETTQQKRASTIVCTAAPRREKCAKSSAEGKRTIALAAIGFQHLCEFVSNQGPRALRTDQVLAQIAFEDDDVRVLRVAVHRPTPSRSTPKRIVCSFH